MGNNSFYDKMLPYATRASSGTNLPIPVILAQWGIESDEGKSDLAIRALNFAGIKYSKYSKGVGASGAYEKYSSINNFVDDYIRVMGLSYYDKVRSAVSVNDTAVALGNSPWAESSYAKGQNIIKYITANSLTKYDGMKVAAVIAPTVKKKVK